MGYFTTDLLIIMFLSKNTDALFREVQFHHGVCIIGLFCSICSGYGIPGVVNCMMLSEISTIFLNYRMLVPRERMGEPLPMCN
jgi:hypothetical protein